MLPILEFEKEDFIKSIKKNLKANSLILVDQFNFDLLSKKFEKIYLVKNNSIENIEKIKLLSFENIIAIGGCTTLDVARAISNCNNLVVFPSIISTACISNNRSILLGQNKEDLIIKTVAPTRTIINLNLIRSSTVFELKRWTISGISDILARISASIEFLYYLNIFKLETLKALLPSEFWLLDYLTSRDSLEMSDELLVNVATLSHLASIEVIQRDGFALSSAGEHHLYYIMRRLYGYNSINPTHGEFVSIGNLLSVKIFSLFAKNDYLFSFLQKAYKIASLPTNYSELEKIGIKKEQLLTCINNLNEFPEKSFLKDYFSRDGNLVIVDEIFNN